MSYVLLHINEFNYLLFSGSVRVHGSRVVDLQPDSDGRHIFCTAGYLKYSSPESYLLCGIDRERISSSEENASDLLLEMTGVQEIIPLTEQAEILLRPVIHRARLLVKAPIFEAAWHKFVDDEILRERCEAAIAFVRLFGCEKLEREAWRPASGLFLFMLKDLGSGLNEIERRSESAELGVFEFCVRLAHEHDAVWRRDDPRYAGLKKARESELASKRLSTSSFLNFPRVCLALKEFEEESITRFGYSPFSLVAFFEFYRTHSRANGINFAQVKAIIQLLLTYGRTDDASDYAHLVGYSLGLDEVTPTTYFVQSTRFSVFDHAPSQYPRSEDLIVSLPSEISNFLELPAELQSPPAPDGVDSDLFVRDATPPSLGVDRGETTTALAAQVSAGASELRFEEAAIPSPSAGASHGAVLESKDPGDSITGPPVLHRSDTAPAADVESLSDASEVVASVVAVPVAENVSGGAPSVSVDDSTADVAPVLPVLPADQNQLIETLATSSESKNPEVETPQPSKRSGRKGNKAKKKDQDIPPVTDQL